MAGLELPSSAARNTGSRSQRIRRAVAIVRTIVTRLAVATVMTNSAVVGLDALTTTRTHTGPLLVAGEDAEHTRGALQIAELLARRDRINAHVLGVIRPLTLPGNLLSDADREALEDGRRRTHTNLVRQRVHQAAGIAPFFSVEAQTGTPAMMLAGAARERGSELIVVGLQEHGAPQRNATEDAALQIAQAAPVPVLAVPVKHALLPKHALVAMDFSPPSRRAAQSVIPLLNQRAKLTLAYVEPEVNFAALGRAGWPASHGQDIVRLFDALIEELSVPGDISVDAVVLHGDPAAALLEHAASVSVDLIASGTQGENVGSIQLPGSVAMALLRGAECSVLIAPPARATDDGAADLA